jgi:phospholipase/carboxylesterase
VTADLGFEHVLVRGTGALTLLLLHGTGGDEHQLVELGRRLAPEATLISPRGKELENGLYPRFFRRLRVGEFDLPNLVARTDELADFVGRAAEAYDLDAEHIIAFGYSNGANIAASVLLRRPGVLAGAALLRATLPYEPEATPERGGKRVLLATGTRDPYVPEQLSDRLADLLEAGGAEVTYLKSDLGHELAQSELERVHEWLEREP